MELFFGYQFQEFYKARKAVITEELLNRAVKKGILTLAGVQYIWALTNPSSGDIY